MPKTCYLIRYNYPTTTPVWIATGKKFTCVFDKAFKFNCPYFAEGIRRSLLRPENWKITCRIYR